MDSILSEDSQALVKEHMGKRKECRKMLEDHERGGRERQARNKAITGLRVTQSW